MSLEYWKNEIDNLEIYPERFGGTRKFNQWRRQNPGSNFFDLFKFQIDKFIADFINNEPYISISNKVLKYLFRVLSSAAIGYYHLENPLYLNTCVEKLCAVSVEMNRRVIKLLGDTFMEELSKLKGFFEEKLETDTLDNYESFQQYFDDNLESDLTLPNNPEMKLPLQNEEIEELIKFYASSEYIRTCIKNIEQFYSKIDIVPLKQKWLSDEGSVYLSENHAEFLTDIEIVLACGTIDSIDPNIVIKCKDTAKKIKGLVCLTDELVVKMSPDEEMVLGDICGAIINAMDFFEWVLSESEINRLQEIGAIFGRYADQDILVTKTDESNGLLCKVTGCNEAEYLEGLINEVRNLIDITIYLIRKYDVSSPILK